MIDSVTFSPDRHQSLRARYGELPGVPGALRVNAAWLYAGRNRREYIEQTVILWALDNEHLKPADVQHDFDALVGRLEALCGAAVRPRALRVLPPALRSLS